MGEEGQMQQLSESVSAFLQLALILPTTASSRLSQPPSLPLSYAPKPSSTPVDAHTPLRHPPRAFPASVSDGFEVRAFPLLPGAL